MEEGTSMANLARLSANSNQTIGLSQQTSKPWLSQSGSIDRVSKVLFILASIPRLVTVIFFSAYDTKCILFEHASVLNCSQHVFFSDPKHWVYAWLILSMISSALVIFIVALNFRALNYQLEKAKEIRRKGSFFSLIFLLTAASLFYFLRIVSTSSSTANVYISILIFAWDFATVAVVCCLNYLPRVRWENTGLKCCSLVWWKHCSAKNSNFIIYWIALFVYFVEVLCNLTAVMFTVAQDVAPVLQTTFPDETGQYRPVMVIVIGFNLAFHARLLSFFWQKIFHGDKDLFSEPNGGLIEGELLTRNKTEYKIDFDDSSAIGEM